MPAATVAPPRPEAKKYALDWTAYVRDFCIAAAHSQGVRAFSAGMMGSTTAACRESFKAACRMVEAGPDVGE